MFDMPGGDVAMTLPRPEPVQCVHFDSIGGIDQVPLPPGQCAQRYGEHAIQPATTTGDTCPGGKHADTARPPGNPHLRAVAEIDPVGWPLLQ